MLTSGYFRIMTMSLRPWLTRHWLWRRRSLRVSGLRSNVGVSDHGAATARPRVYLVTAGARAGGLMADSNRWLMDSFDRSKHISMNHIFKYITTHMLNIIQVTIDPKISSPQLHNSKQSVQKYLFIGNLVNSCRVSGQWHNIHNAMMWFFKPYVSRAFKSVSY